MLGPDEEVGRSERDHGVARKWIEQQLPRERERPLSSALARASRRERQTVLEGLAILETALRSPLAGADEARGGHRSRRRCQNVR